MENFLNHNHHDLHKICNILDIPYNDDYRILYSAKNSLNPAYSKGVCLWSVKVTGANTVGDIDSCQTLFKIVCESQQNVLAILNVSTDRWLRYEKYNQLSPIKQAYLFASDCCCLNKYYIDDDFSQEYNSTFSSAYLDQQGSIIAKEKRDIFFPGEEDDWRFIPQINFGWYVRDFQVHRWCQLETDTAGVKADIESIDVFCTSLPKDFPLYYKPFTQIGRHFRFFK